MKLWASSRAMTKDRADLALALIAPWSLLLRTWSELLLLLLPCLVLAVVVATVVGIVVAGTAIIDSIGGDRNGGSRRSSSEDFGFSVAKLFMDFREGWRNITALDLIRDRFVFFR